jgi:hypothetical protein
MVDLKGKFFPGRLFLDFWISCLASRWSPKIREKSSKIAFWEGLFYHDI